MKYCSLQHRALLLSPVHPHVGIAFALPPSLHSFWSYFSIDLQSHIGHLLTWGVPLSVSCHFAFSFCSWGSQGKNTEVVCHSLLQWTAFCQTSSPWPVHLGGPHTARLSFIELDKAVVLWSDWLVFCDCGFSLSALWCPLVTPTVLFVFPLGVGYLFIAALAKCSHCSLPWMRSRGHPSWPWTWSSSSQPSFAYAATAPWTWGSSSWPLPLTSDVG